MSHAAKYNMNTRPTLRPWWKRHANYFEMPSRHARHPGHMPHPVTTSVRLTNTKCAQAENSC